MTEEEPLNGFTGFARRKPGFVPASVSVGHTPVGPRAASNSRSSVTNDPLAKYPFSPSKVSSVAQGAFQYARDHERDESGKLQFDPDKLRTISAVDRRWSWVEVDLAAIRHNVGEFRRRMVNRARLMAVVNADGYGHGAVQVARTALSSGAEWLGVATVDEAIELREAMVNAPILVLSEPPAATAPLLLAYKVTPSVYTPEFAIAYAETADAFGLTAPYHLAVNTGMNRIGVRYDQVLEFMMQIGFHRALELNGVFTNFATAGSSELMDFQIQAKHFIEAVSAMRSAGIDPGIVHCANTVAAARFGDIQFDMVRLGVSMYGLHGSDETRSLMDLHPAMSVHARITDVRTVPFGEGVSYGLEYRSPGSVKVCTIPVGYADGLSFGLSGRTDVILNGRRCRQVGQICMDMCMFEVDMRMYGTRRRLDPQIGDEVLLVGRQGDEVITLDEMADALGSINYEIACGFGLRMPKVYK